MATPSALAKKAARDAAATLAAVEAQAAKLDALQAAVAKLTEQSASAEIIRSLVDEQAAVAELTDAVKSLTEQMKTTPPARRSTKK